MNDIINKINQLKNNEISCLARKLLMTASLKDYFNVMIEKAPLSEEEKIIACSAITWHYLESCSRDYKYTNDPSVPRTELTNMNLLKALYFAKNCLEQQKTAGDNNHSEPDSYYYHIEKIGINLIYYILILPFSVIQEPYDDFTDDIFTEFIYDDDDEIF